MGSKSYDTGNPVKQFYRHEGREADLIAAVWSPPADGAGLTIARRCSLIWPAMDREIVDDSGKPAGWSHAGIVERVHSCLRNWTPGERVSGIGDRPMTLWRTTFIPADLAAKVPSNVSIEEAAFLAPGALALQATRMAGISKGETVAVIGLGLSGRLICRLLVMIGCRVLGLDGHESGADDARIPEVYRLYKVGQDSASRIMDVTSGAGADAVIITADSGWPNPEEFAGLICRKKGTVVAVDAAIQNSYGSIYLEKELSFRATGCLRSEYRRTAEKNAWKDGADAQYGVADRSALQSFLDLISRGEIEAGSLITHRFDIGADDDAYEIISGLERGKCLGVLLNYEPARTARKTKLTLPKWTPDRSGGGPGISMGIIGVEGNEDAETVRELKGSDVFEDRKTMSSEDEPGAGETRQLGFEPIRSHPEELITNPAVDSVYIANVHNRHAQWIVRSLLAGKPTFVDKCLCQKEEELEEIEAAHLATGAPLMVGYSRRFAPLAARIREILKVRRYPVSMYYRINPDSAASPGRHWNSREDCWPILYEICNYVDLISFLVGARPTSIHARALSMPDNRYRCDDNLQIMIRLSEGSVATINHASSGNSLVSSEYLEILGDGLVVQLDDFRSLVTAFDGKLKTDESKIRETGKRKMLRLWHYYLVTGLGSPMPFDALKDSSLAGFRIMESLAEGNSARMVD